MREYKEYRVLPCVDEDTFDGIEVRRPESGESPQYYGVYGVDEYGLDIWLADFCYEEHAVAFIMIMS